MSERTPITGIAIMEARSEAILRETRLGRAIESRAASPEVALLNDTAEMEIYGSGARTYHDTAGNVIASPANPIKGEIAQFKENRRYGRTEAERDAVADKYANDVQALRDDGFELCQAKMIMDLRKKDSDITAKLMAQYLKSGMGPVDAHRKATDVCSRADVARIKLIKKGGAFSSEDYDRLRSGESLYDDDGSYNTVPGSAANNTPSPVDKIREAQRYTLDEALDEGWNGVEYAQLSAIRERSGFRNAKNPRGRRAASNVAPGERVSDQRVESSRLDLEAIRVRNHNAMRQRLLDAGTDSDSINRILHQHDCIFVSDITRQQISERTRLAGFSAEGALGSARVRFYEWWARQGGGGDRFFSRGRLVGTVKKAAVMGAIGLPAGVIGALAAPIAGGALGVAGAALAARGAVGVAKGLASSHIERNSSITVAAAEGEGRYHYAGRDLEEYYQRAPARRIIIGPERVTDALQAGTRREVSRNKARVVKAIGMAALGTGIAAGLSEVGEHLFSGSAHSTTSSTKISKTSNGNGLSGNGPKLEVPKAPAVQPIEASSFTVNPGDGIIDEISRYASEHGQKLTGQQADLIYQKLASINSGGQNLVHLNGSGPSEYLIGKGDWGLSHPGQGTWGPGVQEQLDAILNFSK